MSDSLLRWVVLLLLAEIIALMWASHELIETEREQRTEIAAMRAEIARLKTQPPDGMKCREYKTKNGKIRSCWQRMGV